MYREDFLIDACVPGAFLGVDLCICLNIGVYVYPYVRMCVASKCEPKSYSLQLIIRLDILCERKINNKNMRIVTLPYHMHEN